MGKTKYTAATNIIGSIGTTPQERGLTTQEFKDIQDLNSKNIVEYTNDTLIPEIDRRTLNAKVDNYTVFAADIDETITMTGTKTVTLPLISTTDFGTGFRVRVSNIGTGTVTVASTSTDTIAGAASVSLAPKKSIEAVADAAGTWTVHGFDFTESINAHTGETMTCTQIYTRDVATAGDWVITLPVTLAKAPKLIRFDAILTNHASWGNSDATRNNCMYQIADGVTMSANSNQCIVLATNNSNLVAYAVSAVTTSTITLTRTPVGTSPTGTATVLVTAITH